MRLGRMIRLMVMLGRATVTAAAMPASCPGAFPGASPHDLWTHAHESCCRCCRCWARSPLDLEAWTALAAAMTSRATLGAAQPPRACVVAAPWYLVWSRLVTAAHAASPAAPGATEPSALGWHALAPTPCCVASQSTVAPPPAPPIPWPPSAVARTHRHTTHRHTHTHIHNTQTHRHTHEGNSQARGVS